MLSVPPGSALSARLRNHPVATKNHHRSVSNHHLKKKYEKTIENLSFNTFQYDSQLTSDADITPTSPTVQLKLGWSTLFDRLTVGLKKLTERQQRGLRSRHVPSLSNPF